MTEIASRVDSYLGGRRPDTRPASFDYCYNYFQQFGERGNASAFAEDAHVQESCLQLGFYLASWGMLRGSSDLLRCSLAYYVPVVKVLADVPQEVWNLDVPGYDEESISLLWEVDGRLRRAFHHGPTDTLITKVMLGVFGCIPAFDTYFCRGFGHTYRSRSLFKLRDFYEEHAPKFEGARPRTLDFHSGRETSRCYPVAKVMDMVFVQGRLQAA